MPEESFTRFFVAGIAFRIALIVGAMALAFAGAALGGLGSWEWGRFAGGCTGLLAGALIARLAKQRWDPLKP